MKIALAQTNIVWENFQENCRNCREFIKEAANNNAELVLFPELALSGFSMNTVVTASRAAESKQFYSDAARASGIAIGGGYAARDSDDILAQNRYLIVDTGGDIVLDYQKIHPFSYDGENRYYGSGSKICSCLLHGVRLSAFICYDLRFPEIFQEASKRCELIVVAANWPEARAKHWQILLQARALENQCYVAGVNRTGNAPGCSYSGQTMLAGPHGDILARADSAEQLLFADIDVEAVRKYRKEFPTRQDRKDEFYAECLERCGRNSDRG